MLRTAYGIVKDRDSAEDAVQNALIQAWQHLPNLRETGALRSWLMRIVVNQCMSFKRRLALSTMFLLQSFSEQETYLASQVADYAKGRMERSWDLAQASRAITCEAAKCNRPPLLSRNDAPSNISSVADVRKHPQKAYTGSAEQSAPSVEGC